MPAKFILKRGPTGKFRFKLLASNGKVIATSDAYETKSAAVRGVESVRKSAPDARLDDQTENAGSAGKSARSGTKGKLGRALQRDWEQTKSDLPGLEGKELRQDVGDTLEQAAGKKRTPANDKPTPGR